MESASHSAQRNRGGRIYSLDAYRGMLMLLGIVIHGAIPYFEQKGDALSKGLIEFAFNFVHVFRMPAFFILAGFFGALLWQRYSRKIMLKNRFERIVLPLAGCMFIFPSIICYPILVMDRWFNGSEAPLGDALKQALSDFFPIPDFHHLWFLYYLAWITFGVAWWVHWRQSRGKDARIWHAHIRRSFEEPWRFVFSGAAVHTALAFSPLIFWDSALVGVPTQTDWIPNFGEVFYYTLFYGFGWLLFTSETDLKKSTKKAWRLVLCGCLCVPIYMSLDSQFRVTPFTVESANFHNTILCIVLVLVWSVSLFALFRGLMGLFYRYAPKASNTWRYVSDSSYWIYLIHLTFALELPNYIAWMKLPIIVSFALNLIMTTLIGLVSYDLFVRSTFIGRFLNGRRYARMGWRLNAPGLCAIVLFFGSGVIAGWPTIKSERLWAARGGAFSQLPFDLKSNYLQTLTRPDYPNCKGVGRYVYCKDSVTFDEANHRCASMGARLPLFDDELENDSVSHVTNLAGTHHFWLGVTDRNKEGRWKTLNNSPLTFTRWHKGEPNDHGGDEDCGMANSNGQWNDVSCDSSLPFVCQFQVPIEAPSPAPCKTLANESDQKREYGTSVDPNKVRTHAMTTRCDTATSDSNPKPSEREAIPELRGEWVPDLDTIWAHTAFTHLPQYKRNWSNALGHLGAFKVFFRADSIVIQTWSWDAVSQLKAPYTLKAKTADAITFSVMTNGVQTDHTIRVSKSGLTIRHHDTQWALKRPSEFGPRLEP